MTNLIDNAVARVQAIADAISSVTLKAFPTYPIESEEPLPCSIAYMSGGRMWVINSSTQYFAPTISVEFHFSRLNLKKTYQDIYAVSLEFCQRLAGDPTLNGTVSTILAGADEPLPFTVRPFEWVSDAGRPVLVSQMLLFDIPVKSLQSPTATP